MPIKFRERNAIKVPAKRLNCPKDPSAICRYIRLNRGHPHSNCGYARTMHPSKTEMTKRMCLSRGRFLDSLATAKTMEELRIPAKGESREKMHISQCFDRKIKVILQDPHIYKLGLVS